MESPGVQVMTQCFWLAEDFKKSLIPPLADLVTKAAKDLKLGWSFSPA